MLFFGCGGDSSAIAIKLAPRLKKIGLVDIDLHKQAALVAKLKNLSPQATIVEFKRPDIIDCQDFDVFYNGTGLGKYSDDPLSINYSPIIPGDKYPDQG